MGWKNFSRTFYLLVCFGLHLLTACSHTDSHLLKAPTDSNLLTSHPESPADSLAINKTDVDVVIIGAGLSGLATAYELKKAGLSYRILEVAPRWGGRVRTVRYNHIPRSNFAIENPVTYSDSGMEEYWESNPALRVIKELNLPTRHDVAVSSIRLQGKLYELGDEEPAAYYARVFSGAEKDLLHAFKLKTKAIQGQLKSKPLAQTLKPLINISFESWTKSTLESLAKKPAKKKFTSLEIEKVANWIRISTECEIGTEWQSISALDGIAEFHIFLGQNLLGEDSYRVIGGNDQFTDALANAVGEKNILLNHRVTKIVHHTPRGHGPEEHYNEVSFLNLTKNEFDTFTAKAVVSTIPLYRLFEIQTKPALSSKKWQAIQTQKYGSYFKAHVFIDRDAIQFYHRGDSSILPILSDSPLGVIYEGNPDQTHGLAVLSLLITGSQAEAFNFMPLDQVRIILKSEFEKMWPGFAKYIREIEFYRYHPRAIAAWPVGRSRFDELSDEIRKPENGLYLAGDFTESSHSDGAFLSALRVSHQIVFDLQAYSQHNHDQTTLGK